VLRGRQWVRMSRFELRTVQEKLSTYLKYFEKTGISDLMNEVRPLYQYALSLSTALSPIRVDFGVKMWAMLGLVTIQLPDKQSIEYLVIGPEDPMKATASNLYMIRTADLELPKMHMFHAFMKLVPESLEDRIIVLPPPGLFNELTHVVKEELAPILRRLIRGRHGLILLAVGLGSVMGGMYLKYPFGIIAGEESPQRPSRRAFLPADRCWELFGCI